MSEDFIGPGALRAASTRELVGASDAVLMTKPRLLALTNAVHRSFSSSFALSLATGRAAETPSLVVALFQHRCYFEAERRRFEALGALGVATLVGYPGEPGALPSDVEHVDLAGRKELEDAWVLSAFDGSFGATIVAIDDRGLVPAESLEAGRRFVVRSSIEPDVARVGLRQLLAPLRPRLTRRTIARIEGALAASEESSEDRSGWLQTLSSELIAHFEPGLQKQPRDAIAERDLLTGIYNRTFLEHYLPKAGASALRVAVSLIDLDDLGELNDRRGVAAGDAALVGVAHALAAECRPGEVLVRHGSDEFVMISPVEGKKAALSLARRLVVAARAARFDHPFETETVTVSVATLICDPADIDFHRLEESLAEAKSLGKNLARLSD